MKISYAILCHNETDSLRILINHILDNANNYDREIVIIYDEGDNKETSEILENFGDEIIVHKRALNKDYAKQKNFMTEMCSGDWIINPDSDELLPAYILHNAHQIIEQNGEVEVIWMPRINLVEGVTDVHIRQWGWRINEHGWINWPDYQSRMYKRDYPRIHWESPVHERIVGFKGYSLLPDTVDMAQHLAIKHMKDIKTQEMQNQTYGQIFTEFRNKMGR